MSHPSRLVAFCCFFWLLAGCTTVPPAIPSPAPTAAAIVNTPIPTLAPTATPVPATPTPAPTPLPSAINLWSLGSNDLEQRARLTRVLTETAALVDMPIAVTVKSQEGLYADVQADLLAGQQPPELVLATQEELALLQRAGLLSPAVDGLDEQAFIPSVVGAGVLDGTRWGTPIGASGALLLLYNKKLTSSVPDSTDGLISLSRAAKTGDNVGLVAAWVEPRWFTAWLSGFGGGLVGSAGEPTLNTPQMISALNLLRELRQAGPQPPSTYMDGVRLFRRGYAAYALDGDWSLAMYRKYSETLDLGIARMPIVPATGRIAAPPLNGIYLLYRADLTDTQRQQAQAFASALTAPEAQRRLAAEAGMLPALKSVLSDPAVQNDPALAAAGAQTEGGVTLVGTRGLRCAWEAVRLQLAPVLLSERSPEESAQLMQENADRCAAR